MKTQSKVSATRRLSVNILTQNIKSLAEELVTRNDTVAIVVGYNAPDSSTSV